MDKEKIQALMTSKGGAVPVVMTAENIAGIMLDEKHFPRYRNIAQQKRMEWLSLEMKSLATITRMKDFNAQEAVAASIVLDEMIMQDRFIPDLTLLEMHNAFRNGVFGLYGEFYGISSPNLYGFLNCHCSIIHYILCHYIPSSLHHSSNE